MINSNISVLITNYNYDKYLDLCLSRLVKQSLPAAEIIIIDDASTDNSLDIINKYCTKYKSIKLIKNSQNQGVLKNQKTLLSLAKYKYIYWASTDDFVHLDFFQNTMLAFSLNKKTKIAFSYPSTFKNNKVNISQILKKIQKITYFSPGEFSNILKYSVNYLHINTVIFEKDIFIKSGSFIGEELKGNYDMIIYHVIAFRYGISFIPMSLAYLRLHNDHFSNATKREKKNIFMNFLKHINDKKYKDIKKYFIQSGILVAIMNNSFILLVWSKNFFFISFPYLYWYLKINIKNFLRNIF